MPQSKKDLKKAEQRAKAKAGIAPEPKKAPLQFAACALCKVLKFLQI